MIIYIYIRICLLAYFGILFIDSRTDTYIYIRIYIYDILGISNILLHKQYHIMMQS